jgi:hypothetical protein
VKTSPASKYVTMGKRMPRRRADDTDEAEREESEQENEHHLIYLLSRAPMRRKDSRPGPAGALEER